jgi:hypothetical protein
MSRAAPLRFLGAMLGGWVCLRALFLGLGAGSRIGAVAEPVAQGAPPPPAAPGGAPAAVPPAQQAFATARSAAAAPWPLATARIVQAGSGAPDLMGESRPAPLDPPGVWPPPGSGIGPAAMLPAPQSRGQSRWSASAWLLARGEHDQVSLAPGGTLGGSQAGGRLLYRLDRHWSLSARAYLPLRRPAGAEIAAGVDWRPIASMPVSLLAERRQAIGSEGRSAFSITAYGGFSRAIGARIRLDGYAQGGIVGVRSRDLFVDGSLRAVATRGRLEAGGGAWGAAQPGAARLDIGPSLSYRLPVANGSVRIEADWRFRIAGDALPASGPALVFATDF